MRSDGSKKIYKETTEQQKHHGWHLVTRSLPTPRIGLTAGHGDRDGTADAPLAPDPSTAEVRAWARAHGIDVPDRGRLRPEVWQAWQQVHQPRP